MGITNIETKVWDATVPDVDIINKADVVIADLPCSGLGVLGKKYDIKYKMTQNQQKELVELQRKILNVVSEYVKPGGILIYSTCTVDRNENIETWNGFWLIMTFLLKVWIIIFRRFYIQIPPNPVIYSFCRESIPPMDFSYAE